MAMKQSCCPHCRRSGAIATTKRGATPCGCPSVSPHSISSSRRYFAYNERSLPPLEKQEIMTLCDSAWAYTQNNQNRFGQHGAYFTTDEIVSMLHDQDAILLLAFLRAHNGPWATFMVANGLTETLGWRRHRLAAARTRLIEMGYLIPVRQAGKGVPALFKWGE